MDEETMPVEAAGPEQMQAANDNRASPEEDAQCTQFVGRAMELVNKLAPQIHELLRGGADEGQGPEETGANGPAQGLARATVMILSKVGSAAEEAGQTLSPDVVFAAGTQIFEQIAEESDALGISDYANDRDSLEAAYLLTIDMAIDEMAQSGELDQAGAQEAMERLKAMDANGELEQMFLDLNAKDQGGAKEAAPAAEPEPAGGMMPRGM